MTVTVDLDNHCVTHWSPAASSCQLWIQEALDHIDKQSDVSLSVRIVSAGESRELNQHYRGKSAATNVLSFPARLPEAVIEAVVENIGFQPLGDIVICPEVIEHEAQSQDKPLESHWTHMLVHGLLHLLGHDHQDPEQGAKMEQMEVEILKKLGIPNPYLIG